MRKILLFRFNMIIKSLLSVVIILLSVISLVKAQDSTKVVAVFELVRMNMLLAKVDNPVKIAVLGVQSSELEVSIDNGTITGNNGEYLIHPVEIGSATITIKHKGKEIQKKVFRVKHSYLNPMVVLTKGNIDIRLNPKMLKTHLLEADGLKVKVDDTDYDVKFKIVGFAISTSENDSIKLVSQNDKFTAEQNVLLKQAKSNSKIFIEDFMVEIENVDLGGPRKLPNIIFIIID